MNTARETFHNRMSTIAAAIADFGLQDHAPTPSNIRRNNSARLIRCGLAIQCFNIFEDFLRSRMNESLLLLADSNAPFSLLPDKLRYALTANAMKSTTFRMKLQHDKNSQITYIQKQCSSIASTAHTSFHPSDVSFFHAASNISTDDIREALSAFSVQHPWEQISGLCSRIGLSALPSKDVFDAFASRRHDAAHNPSTSISETDLSQSVQDACGLAIGFDLLLSESAKSISRITSQQIGYTLTDHRSLRLRFIKRINGQYCEYKEYAKRASYRSRDFALTLSTALAHATRDNSYVIDISELGIATCRSA